MNGLGQATAPPQGAPQPPQEAPQPQDARGLSGAPASKQATPEQEEQFANVYSAAVLMLYNEKFKDKAAQMLKGGEDPVAAMAQLGSMIYTRTIMEMSKRGNPVEPIVIIEAGRAFMNEVGDLAKLLKVEVTDDDVENAFYIASDTVRESMVAAGLITQEDLEAGADEAQGMASQEEMDGVTQKIAAAKGRIKERVAAGGKPQGADK